MKVLFVFHEAHLTGAPLTLYKMVKWLSTHSDISMSFLFQDEGILVKDISKIGSVYFWNREPLLPPKSILERVFDLFKKQKTYHERLIEKFENEKFDLVYANTIVSSNIIILLSHLKCKVVWHIHELELAINFIGKNNLEAYQYVDLIIANSGSTLKNLKNYGIDEKKIKVLYPTINYKEIINSNGNCNLKEFLGIPDDAFIIGTSGTGIDRKGLYTFVQLPILVDFFLPGNNFYYLWIGKNYNCEIIEYDLKKLGLEKRMIFVGEQNPPFPYYKIFDIFVSCSKEESFGLSAIEAAALGKPLICFEKTGGLEEIVKQANNIIVPYLNIIEMSKEIIGLYKDRDKLNYLGSLASDYALQFDENSMLPEFAKILFEITTDKTL